MKKWSLLCYLAAFVVVSNAEVTLAQRVELSFTRSNHPNVSLYRIYRTNEPDSGFVLLATIQHPRNSYIDNTVEAGLTYFYAVTAVDVRGNESGFSNIVSRAITYADARVSGFPADIPADFELRQNYPNPFNPTTNIAYSLPVASHVLLTIYNATGQLITNLVDEFQQAGDHEIRWSGVDSGGRSVVSGTYFYRIKTAGGVTARKMVLLR